ncbi:MAG: ComF family protein [Bryobacterales bacterium]|nr:ComF family protein [Bryobacteraceae bacterium]MDW8131024.1 ComF family protein [Bryobacterales bacterium]
MAGLVPQRLAGFADELFAPLLWLLFPDECRICGEPLRQASRVPVCANCLRTPEPLSAEHFCARCRTPFLNRAPLDQQGCCALCRRGLRAFDAAYCWGAYEGRLRELIHLFKYGGVRPLGKVLGEWMALAMPRELNFDRIVPAPLHWRRRLRRGFNQAELLAAEVARRFGRKPENLLRRVRATAAQAGLSHSARRANVAGAFRVRRGVRLEGQRVLLVDDVMTTGATAAACAQALKQAGARYVAVLTLARADRRPLLAAPPAKEAA